MNIEAGGITDKDEVQVTYTRFQSSSLLLTGLVTLGISFLFLSLRFHIYEMGIIKHTVCHNIATVKTKIQSEG